MWIIAVVALVSCLTITVGFAIGIPE